MTTTIHHSLAERADAGAMDDTTDPDPEVPERARGPRRYSARYKAQVLAEYETLDKAGKGALLRREGLYTSLISEWRKQRDRGALITQRRASPHTIASYRDTFRLLLGFAQNQTGKAPSELDLTDLNAPIIGAFLGHLEHDRHNSVRTRNARLVAVHARPAGHRTLSLTAQPPPEHLSYLDHRDLPERHRAPSSGAQPNMHPAGDGGPSGGPMTGNRGGPMTLWQNQRPTGPMRLAGDTQHRFPVTGYR